MRISDLLGSVRHLFARRARAALTLLGVIIGTASIVLLAGLLHGGEDALIRSNQDATDSDLVEVRSDAVPLHQREKTRRELSRTDADVLAGSRSLGGATVASENTRTTRAMAYGKKKRVTMVSAGIQAPTLYRLTLAVGRYFDTDDLEARRRICVIGHEVWVELLGSPASLDGIDLSIDDQRWAVVGVLEDKPMLGTTDGTWIWNRKVLVPETTFDGVFPHAHEVNKIFVRQHGLPEIVTPLDTLRAVTKATLLRRHFGVKNFDMNEGHGKDQEQLILDVVKLLLLGTGVVALFVGGINIMNIMLVTVSERTREIGVRRAVGAPRRSILAQFLVESATVALLGGILGIAAGVSSSWLVAVVLRRLLGHWAFHVEPWSVVLGVVLSLVTGIVFGLYPAWRAARLDPIDALRSD